MKVISPFAHICNSIDCKVLVNTIFDYKVEKEKKKRKHIYIYMICQNTPTTFYGIFTEYGGTPSRTLLMWEL
jgi:hypothetical protein